MTSLQWRNFRSNDFAQPLSVEEIFKRYAGWAGIHDTNFNVLYENASYPVTSVAPNTWTYSLVPDLLLPANFTVRYHVNGSPQGVIISGGSILIFVWTNPDGNVFVGHTPTDAVQFVTGVGAPEEADVEIVFRQQNFDDITGIIWRSVTVYMNGRWITTWSDYVGQAFSNLSLGFLAYDEETIDYTNVVIPELGDTAEFGTLDPGEYAMGGLQRTLEGRYLHYFVRFDGSLRAWKKKQRDSVLTLLRPEGLKRSFDLPSLITHARMMGAYIWSEAIDADNIIIYGHRFQEVNNSMLLTQFECLEEAENTLKRSQEEAFTVVAQDRHIPILEPEDRIEIDGDDWIINSYSVSVGSSNMMEVYNCRRYVWGT